MSPTGGATSFLAWRPSRLRPALSGSVAQQAPRAAAASISRSVASSAEDRLPSRGFRLDSIAGWASRSDSIASGGGVPADAGTVSDGVLLSPQAGTICGSGGVRASALQIAAYLSINSHVRMLHQCGAHMHRLTPQRNLRTPADMRRAYAMIASWGCTCHAATEALRCASISLARRKLPELTSMEPTGRCVVTNTKPGTRPACVPFLFQLSLPSPHTRLA